MTNTTIPNLPISNAIPNNSLFPFENTLIGETEAVTLSTIIDQVPIQTKVYVNSVLQGVFPAVNFINGTNVNLSTTNNSNYLNIQLNSTIPNTFSLTNTGGGIGLYKDFTTTYNIKSLIAGSNITITPNTDTVTISAGNIGEANTVNSVGGGISIYKNKTGSTLNFKSLIAGVGISFDATLPDSITINSSGGGGGNLNSAQNIGTGQGTIYTSTFNNSLQLKTLKAGSNISISNSASEIIISSSGSAGGLNNTSGTGSKIVNTSGLIKTVIAGDGILIQDTESSITLSTNTGNEITNVGVGIPIYKSFNNVLDKHEFRTLIAGAGVTLTQENINEITISANGTNGGSITSTGTINSLISSQSGSNTVLKVLSMNSVAGQINDNANNLNISINNGIDLWNANKLRGIPVLPINTALIEESSLIYRGGEFVSDFSKKHSSSYVTGQSFVELLVQNFEVFKPNISNTNPWTKALLTDSTSPLVTFLAIYIAGNLYFSNNQVPGFTGLVTGTVYYLTNDSKISTTPSSIIVGVALSPTTLWFKTSAA